MRFPIRYVCIVALVVPCIALSAPAHAKIQIRGGGFGIRLEPEGDDAENFSKASWGGGLYVITVCPGMANFLAGVVGIDIINMLSQTIEFRDQVTMLRIEQQTNQWLSRFYAGGRLGHQGHGVIRPYVGANVALNYYSISTDVVIPDDRDYENEIRQHLKKETEYAFGFDVSLGVEFNIKDVVFIDVGAKYLKTFSVPQQFGPNAETIHPQYVQMYAGLNIRFQ
jgi:opacity protein-like surface antigen